MYFIINLDHFVEICSHFDIKQSSSVNQCQKATNLLLILHKNKLARGGENNL